MCTLTLVPGRGGPRLAFNRDEQRSRPAGLPPRLARHGGRLAALPLDPAGGGTWLAVNDAGLALALLNVNPRPPAGGGWPARPRAGRGSIIPGLLDCATLEEAVRRAAALAPADYAPFRLVLAQGEAVADLRSDGASARLSGPARLPAPVLFTSSGLGDHLVEGPRRALFEGHFRPAGDWRRQQGAFHRHSWPERPHLSVCMRRADACTVSHSVVEVGPQGATFAYQAGAPDRAGPPQVLELPFAKGG
jgi:hypothetical protein